MLSLQNVRKIFRTDEVDGKHYHFIDVPTFIELN